VTGEFPPVPHSPEALGRPSRKAVTAALKAHLEVLDGQPLRLALSEALREATSLGGQERRFAALVTRELSRHQRLLDLTAKQLGFPPGRWGLREDAALMRYVVWRRLFTGQGWDRSKNEVGLPGPIRPRSVKDEMLRAVAEAPLKDVTVGEGTDKLANLHSFPGWLVEALEKAYPGELAALLPALNREPPIQLRVRPPLSAEDAQRRLAEEDGVQTRIASENPPALVVEGLGHKIFESNLFKSHALQQQDWGSQLIVELCRPRSGQAASRVLDFCAGAGGKTMGLADQVGPQGKVVASDLSRRRLDEGRTRIRAAGLKNVSFPHPADPTQADVILVDAPCSGTGSVAREPDQKWKLKPADIESFSKKQRDLLDELAPKLPVGGLLVYATCSVLPAENEDVVAAFLRKHPGYQRAPAEEVLGQEHHTYVRDHDLHVLPQLSTGGGFYAARLKRLR